MDLGIDRVLERPATASDSDKAPWLPAEARLSMPAQDLWRHTPGIATPPLGEAGLLQISVFLLAGGLAVYGGVTAYNVLQVDGLTILEGVDLVLFQILFAWIAYALACAVIGFSISLDSHHGSQDPEPAVQAGALIGRTAILMPVHNEDPHGVFARLGNIDQSIRDLGAEKHFDIFLLSDTRDAEIKLEEMAAFERLRRTTGQASRLFYRSREDNTGRKAGNVADWVKRFGGAYDFMVVLDADSVMDGETLVSLAACMDQQPRTALIQTVPRLVNRMSLFGRVNQFASRLYGPMLSEGLAHTSGMAGNYWGHNAIIRVAAFAAHAGLPHLRGPRPLGGEVMSHDFVEAALMRRGGWDIRLAPHLGGSYEECPPTLPDMIARERRWCQGNIQHLPLVAARGLHWMSRVHLAQGVLTYLMPPLWLAFLIVGALLSAEASWRGAYGWDGYNLDMLKWLLSISLLSLFIPRILALIRALVRRDERGLWGDTAKLVAGVLCETLLSVLVAPTMMVAQSRALVEIIIGRHSGWPVQQRADGALVWRETARRYMAQTVIGGVAGVAALFAAPAIVLWLSPVVIGLLLSIPLAVLTSDPRWGARLKHMGLLVTPEELIPPPVLSGLAQADPCPETAA